MTIDQIIIISLIFLVLLTPLITRWRFDVVGVLAILVVILAGLITPEAAFAGFTHPAVIIVASMFIISQTLISSGVIDIIIRRLAYVERHPLIQLLVLSSVVALASAFINGVGALALSLPIAIHLAKKNQVSPSIYLLPMAFASHLGGFLTLIGTPRNLIVSSFRESAGFEPFAMFDFAYVGLSVTAAGIVFLSFIGWQFLPRRKAPSNLEVDVKDYVAEIKIPKTQKFLVEYIRDLRESIGQPFLVVAVIRGDNKILQPSGLEELLPDDNLLIKADADTLTNLVEVNKLSIVGRKSAEGKIGQDDEDVDMEAVVQPQSYLVGLSWKDIGLNLRFGANLLAVSRSGADIREHLDEVRFHPSDVLLLSGRRETLIDTIGWLGLLPLAERMVTFGRSPKIWLSLGLFVLAVFVATTGWLPISVVFLATAVVMVMTGLISLRQTYESVQWPVIVILGSMITLGNVFESTGGADLIAGGLEALSFYVTPVMMLAVVLILSMLMSDFMNAMAAAVLMSPVAILVAGALGVSIDPFLMAVAIGSSSAFLTPSGHESNLLVMGPGGYKFGDYWRVGLPLEILIVALSLPLLLHFWPL